MTKFESVKPVGTVGNHCATHRGRSVPTDFNNLTSNYRLRLCRRCNITSVTGVYREIPATKLGAQVRKRQCKSCARPTGRMLYDLFGFVVVVVVVDVLRLLHERRHGTRRVFDDMWLEFVQFRKSLEHYFIHKLSAHQQ